ncbi:hypothetical protein ABEF95_002137 [Exophiala dermatitidis]
MQLHSTIRLVLLLATQLYLVVGASNSTLRYEAGSINTIAGSMVSDSKGIFQLGDDGVLRSYNGDGTVIDWRQQDADQIKRAYDAHNNRGGQFLRRSPQNIVDGRDVVDIDQILRPRQNILDSEFGTSPVSSSGDSTDGEEVVDADQRLRRRQIVRTGFESTDEGEVVEVDRRLRRRQNILPVTASETASEESTDGGEVIDIDGRLRRRQNILPSESGSISTSPGEESTDGPEDPPCRVLLCIDNEDCRTKPIGYMCAFCGQYGLEYPGLGFCEPAGGG